MWLKFGIRGFAELSLCFEFECLNFLEKLALGSLRLYSGFLGGLSVNFGFFALGDVRFGFGSFRQSRGGGSGAVYRVLQIEFELQNLMCSCSWLSFKMRSLLVPRL